MGKRKKGKKQEGENMLAFKKRKIDMDLSIKTLNSNAKYTPAKDKEVIKAIISFDNNHKKMMRMLAK